MKKKAKSRASSRAKPTITLPASDEGRAGVPVKPRTDMPAPENERGGGHLSSDTRRADVPAATNTSAGGGHVPDVTHDRGVAPGAIAALREHQAYRVQLVRTMNALENQRRAFVRRALGFQTELAEASREAINRAAAKLIKDILKDAVPPEQMDVATGVAEFVALIEAAIEPVAKKRAETERKMSALSSGLPVWPWVESVRGLGALGLAIIVGEAGDLGNYANPGKVWKRLGLAPKPEYAMTTKAGETAHCIPRRRRSAMWTIGDSLIKGNKDGYRTLYVERKAYEHGRDPEMSKMHAHRRAQRYMEKRLLRDLWQAWRTAQ